MVIYKFRQLLEEKERREGRRITLEEVAKSAGITRQTITQMTNPGKEHNVTMKVVERLCKYFGCKIEELVEIK